MKDKKDNKKFDTKTIKPGISGLYCSDSCSFKCRY